MALTRITKGVIKPNENYDTHNINSTGIVTAVGANFTGDVNVGGVLTYEDVTSIDSVGIITARNGIDCNGDIDVDGHTNLDNVSIAGVTTHNEDVWFKGATSNRDAYWDKSANTFYFKDNARIYLGDSSDFRIYHTPNSGAYGGSNILGANGHPIQLMTSMNGAGENGIIINPNSGVKLYYDNSIKLETSQKGIKVGTGVTIETNGQANFVGVTTFGNLVGGATTSIVVNRDFVLRDSWGYANHIKFHHSKNTLNFPSASLSNIARLPKLSFGDRTSTSQLGVGDFLMYHDFYNMHMRYYGANGNLIFSNINTEIHIQGSNGSGNPQQSIRIKSGATEGVILYHGGNAKFETAGIGASVYGTLEATGGLTVAGVSTLSGNAYFKGNFIELNNGADSQYTLNRGTTQLFSIRNNGASGVHINTQNSALLCFGVSTGTNNGSVESTLSINSSGNVGIDNQLASEKLHLADNKKLALGNSADLKIYHDGTNSYVNNTTGTLFYLANTHYFTNPAVSEIQATFVKDGAVKLYHNGSQKFETTSSGISVTNQVRIPDGGKYFLGSDDDMYLNHSGSHGAIHNASGNLYISTQHHIYLSTSLNKSAITANANGSVELYHNNVKKFETSADGIILSSTDAGSSAGPEIKLFRNSASPADADYLGQIKFAGESDTGVERNYAKITGKILDASNGTEDGIIEIAHIKAGSQNISARFRSDSLQLINNTNFTVAGTSEFSDLATFTKSGSALRLNDGSILRLGNADADFFIYHDGSSTDYISAGAGKQLRLTTDDFIIKGANNTETLMSAAKDGGVYLYHNNIVRAETTANGFQITNGTLDFANNSGSGASLRNYSAGVFFVGNAAQGDLSLYCQDNTNNSILLQANTGEKYIECNMGGSVDLWYHGGLVAKTTQRGLRLTSNLASSGGVSNMLQLDNTGNNTGDGSKITFSRSGTIRTEIEALKNETANNETDIVFRNTNAGSLYERLRIFGDGSITQNYANPSASAVFRISKSGGGAAELRFDTATVNTSNLYLGTDEQLRIRYGSTEHTRFSSDGFVGINDDTPYTGLTINKEGDYWDTNGNTYAHPEGRVLSAWRGDRNDDTDYWVGFVGKYMKPSATVNILLQPHVGNFNNQAGMYIAGEATGNFSSDFTIGKIVSGNVAGRGTTASSGKRATKSELFRIKNNGNVGINTNNPSNLLHIVHGTAGQDVIKIEGKPLSASTSEVSKINFQITQSNGQSARLAEIVSGGESNWGGQLIFNVKPSNGTPQNTTMEALRIRSSDSAATNLKMVVDAYLQLGGYNNTDESFVNLAVMFSARDMAGSTLVSGQSDTMSGYARRRTTSDGSGTFFFGPYGAFPCGDYTALFRLKVADRSGSSTVGYIDIIGNGLETQGRNIAPQTSARRIDVQTNDFTESDKYQYFALDFSKRNSGAHIETRFLNYSSATTDIYFDHVLILPRINHGFEGGSGVFDY